MDALSIGEYAEQMFTVRAILNGFRVSRPIGHASSYDFIIEKEGRLFRIQVKSTGGTSRNTYQVSLAKGNGTNKRVIAYEKDAFDFYAIYIKPLDKFYIVPKNDLSVKTFCIHRDKEETKYSEYLEKWDM